MFGSVNCVPGGELDAPSIMISIRCILEHSSQHLRHGGADASAVAVVAVAYHLDLWLIIVLVLMLMDLLFEVKKVDIVGVC